MQLKFLLLYAPAAVLNSTNGRCYSNSSLPVNVLKLITHRLNVVGTQKNLLVKPHTYHIKIPGLLHHTSRTFPGYSRPRPFSQTFQAWKVCGSNSRTVRGLYKPCFLLQCFNSVWQERNPACKSFQSISPCRFFV